MTIANKQHITNEVTSSIVFADKDSHWSCTISTRSGSTTQLALIYRAITIALSPALWKTGFPCRSSVIPRVIFAIKQVVCGRRWPFAFAFQTHHFASPISIQPRSTRRHDEICYCRSRMVSHSIRMSPLSMVSTFPILCITGRCRPTMIGYRTISTTVSQLRPSTRT